MEVLGRHRLPFESGHLLRELNKLLSMNVSDPSRVVSFSNERIWLQLIDITKSKSLLKISTLNKHRYGSIMNCLWYVMII